MRPFLGAVAILLWTPIVLFLITLTDETKYSSKSADGKFELQIRQPRLENSWGQNIQLCQARTCEQIPDDLAPGADIFITFVQVAWCDSARYVAIVTHGTAGVKLGYDLQKHARVPFEQVRDCMEEAIRTEYTLPAQIPDLWPGRRARSAADWANYVGADQFRRRHPDAVSTSLFFRTLLGH